MHVMKSTLSALLIPVVLSSISVRRAGWLDRVVEYQKRRFVDDLMKPPVKITARIEEAPPGYVDSSAWDYDSVMRLLTLIRDSEGAAPVRLALRRAMKDNRREHPNDFHDERDSGEYYLWGPDIFKGLSPIDAQKIIIVSNPVEAKLPSATITVSLLRSIMESRAKEGRSMPTTRLNITWPVTPKRSITYKESTKTPESDSASSSATGEVTTAAGQTNETEAASEVATPVNGTSNSETQT
ncbi:uncharacterized protein LOC112049650 isoform X2 [Bicyclus anynana]|uniref:Uncharacterized protein LOC112049650 isoform X2 n=1 Tax=Bicyclus anynana TaxID=110368 RepID=A0ABM3LIZ2_BICAN|nr:uncharacterized protein LOC112049650 isoform X2 [Bicyclus anynana]